ncbi:hypothetical protein [Bdellovibrio sp. GT3]|uniref:hypothetical protein n=1 Tax=Bdellovibrio sp. GT3 TaxID=3136282 RepID=UPI0030F20647
MFLSLYKKAAAVVPVLLIGLTACNPVQFSAPSVKTSESPTPTPTETPTTTPTVSPSPTPNLRDVTYSNTVEASNNKIDIVLVVDDSNSMLADNQKLAAKLSSFVTTLQSNKNLDWQMCLTVTRGLSSGANSVAWGASIYWQTNSASPNTTLGLVLKKGTANLSTIFAQTINYVGAGWAGSNDERAIKAAYRHVYNGDYRYSGASGCYRADAAIAYVIISDEDERSIGGDKTQQYYKDEYYALENEDQPQVFVDYVKSTFGANKRFTVNSIIVKPGDAACMKTQDAGGAKSHYGVQYAALSNLTGGGIGSICEADFGTNLNLFVDKIVDSLGSVNLECTPVGTPVVTITPTLASLSYRVQGMSIVFDTPVPAGSKIEIKYQCDANRTPSSVEQPQSEVGFFTKIMNFFKNLF